MHDQNLPGSKHYRLELGGDRHGPSGLIEFAADGPEAALHAAQRHGGGRDIVVFEDGRPLARLRLAVRHGFWTIHPGSGAAA